ncbi:MAG: SixA phosphatase family protein [Stenotrophobium sp.]
MRLLTLVRHAKSSWDDAKLSDFERPLNERGLRDAPVMAQWAARHLPASDRLISSPALRAITTARVFAQALGVAPAAILVQPRIYEASADTLLNLLRGFDDADGHVMLFGHNPGLSELALQLGRCDFSNLPTCGLAHFSLKVKNWGEVTADCGELRQYSFPKQQRSL